VATPVVAGLLPVSRTLPIVFVYVTDPVGRGLVPDLARPGGKLTGFTSFEAPTEIAPVVRRVPVVFNPASFAPWFWLPVVDAAGANRNTTSPSSIRRFSNTSARQTRHTAASIVNSAAIAPS
jgi:putative ABC transport system substrate-binding protein